MWGGTEKGVWEVPSKGISSQQGGIRRGIEGSPSTSPALHLRYTANRRHRHSIWLILCAPSHFIRSSACQLLWNVYPLLSRIVRIIMSQERGKESLGNFVINEWGHSVAVMRGLTKGKWYSVKSYVLNKTESRKDFERIDPFYFLFFCTQV